MSITKRPKQSTLDIEYPINDIVRIDETKAEAFIAGASEPRAKALPVKTSKTHRQPILIRFDSDLLHKVEKAAQRRGISRSAWIQYILSVALEKGEG
jgi:hypothetical protein